MTKVVHLRPSSKNFGEIAEQATRCLIVDAFLKRRVNTFRTLCTVSVSFHTQLEAEEFHKLLRRTRRGSQ